MILAIAQATARAVLGRRRVLLLLMLASVPLLVALLARDRGGDPSQVAAQTLDLLVIRAVLPISALVLGTAVLGTELEDGTAVFLLTSPIARWRIVAAKLAVAAAGTALIAGSSGLLAGLLVATDDRSLALVGPTVLGIVVGGIVYAAVFMAASLVTTRALIIGLLYTLVWEGGLASLFAGTRLLSVRQYVLAIVDAIAAPTGRPFGETLGLGTVAPLALAVFVLSVAVAVDRLRSWEVSPAD